MLDESRVPADALDKSRGLAAQLLKLERAQEPEEVRQIVRELIARLHGPEYVPLRRAFTVWLGRVVLKRSGITEDIPEFQDLREVDAMLEERAAQWKDEYIRQGVLMGWAEGKAEGKVEGRAEGKAEGRAEGWAEGKAEGKAEGFGLALQDLLEARFGTLPQSVTSYLANSSDANALRKLTLFAYRAESLQAVVDRIKDDSKMM